MVSQLQLKCTLKKILLSIGLCFSEYTQMYLLPFSFLSLSVASIRLFFSQRLGRFCDPDPSLQMVLMVAPLIIIIIAVNLFTLIIIATFFHVYCVCCVFSIVIIMIIERSIFKHIMKPNMPELYSTRSSKIGFTYDRSCGNEEINDILATAILISWVSPLTVWANNFKFTSKFFTVSFMSNIFIYLIYLVLIIVLLNNDSGIVTDIPNIFLCYNTSEYINSTEYRVYGCNERSSIFLICQEECLPVIKTCCTSDSISSDLVGLVWLTCILMVYSIFACLVLQKLGNYYTMYKWSKYVFCCCPPIIHTSLLHDYMRNMKTLENMDDFYPVVEKYVLSDKDIINEKDHLFGETCLHAALDGGLYELMQKMIKVGGDVYIENKYEENVKDLLEKKSKSIAYDEEKIQISKIFKIISRHERRMITYDYDENLMHNVSDVNYLCLLTLIGVNFNNILHGLF